ncbi:hypothetical protein IT411_00350 [Candidatus Peregrinibacteria bacterium]|nr:hypothetical protein [Candidatus Peregrinibacteria bacterium]
MEGKKGCPFSGSLAKFTDSINRIGMVSQARQGLMSDDSEVVERQMAMVDQGSNGIDAKFALESLIINFLWEAMKEERILADKVARDEFFWHKLVANGIGQSLNAWEKLFAAGSLEMFLGNGDQSFFAQTIRKGMAVNEKRGLQDVDIPAAGDLFRFSLGFFRMVLRKIEKQVPAEQVEEKFRAYLASKDLLRLLMQIMQNTWTGGYALTIGLMDLSDSSLGRFLNKYDLRNNGTCFKSMRKQVLLDNFTRIDESCFELDLEKNSLSMTPDCLERAERLAKMVEPESPEKLRGCPLIYAKVWPEMYDWIMKVVLYQLYDDVYPQVKTVPNVWKFRDSVRQSLSKVTPEQIDAVLKGKNYQPYQVII